MSLQSQQRTHSSRNYLFLAQALLIACCALEAADRVLLPATFRSLEYALHVTPSQLGLMTLCQTLAYSIALPFWGAATAFYAPRDLLVLGCSLWSLANFCLAFSNEYYVHLLLRLVNGAALSGVTPLSQALLCETVPENQRGSAFGRLQAVTSASSMLSTWLAISQQSVVVHLSGGIQFHGWQLVYCQIAALSVLVALLVHFFMPEEFSQKDSSNSDAKPVMSTIQTILRIPTFSMLVLQGVFGGIPWNALAFLTLYWQSCGYSDAAVGQLSLVQGFGGIFGSLLGGFLGDQAARIFPDRGRIFVAFSSVALSIFGFLVLFNSVPRDSYHFNEAAVALFFFCLTACWCPASTNRPICAELVNTSSERAQIIALWVMVEGIASGIFGAPLVGFLSEKFGYRLPVGQTKSVSVAGDPVTSAALAHAIVSVGVIAWTICGLFWIVMAFTFPADRDRARLGRLWNEKQKDKV
eukprot:TRINITY_DN12929_c0_g2_i3.p1 TRINITY_DN12929_c0_g2~~TRINITY_DN12929_c0_g2_i3.p1  ORF type:complete len:468 (+),score=64.44 TRINITY_DN12929_c0_g2_i3:191-1594(+)